MDSEEGRICTKCGEFKSLQCFHNSKKGKFKKASICKNCDKIKYAIYKEKNREIINKKAKIYRVKNKNKITKYRRNYYQEHKEERRSM